MEIKVRQLNPAEINKLSYILKNYSCEALIKTGKYIIDGKSVLGLLSAMESSMENDDAPIYLEINELNNEKMKELATKLEPFGIKTR